MRTRAPLLVLATLLASASNAEPNPASNLCDRGGSISKADQAVQLIRFHQAIERRLTPLEDNHSACVERRLGQVESSVEAYCEARGSIGHDLAIQELDDLSNTLSSLQSDCCSEEIDEWSRLVERSYPETCSEMNTSYRNLVRLATEQQGRSADWMQCLLSQLDSITPPVVELCTTGTLSVRATYVEIGERIARRCPNAFSR